MRWALKWGLTGEILMEIISIYANYAKQGNQVEIMEAKCDKRSERSGTGLYV